MKRTILLPLLFGTTALLPQSNASTASTAPMLQTAPSQNSASTANTTLSESTVARTGSDEFETFSENCMKLHVQEKLKACVEAQNKRKLHDKDLNFLAWLISLDSLPDEERRELAITTSPEEFCSAVKAGANVHVTDSRGNTPLHFTAGSESSAPLTIELLAHGAQVNAARKDGQTPLHIAIANNPEIIPVLLNAGANVHQQAQYPQWHHGDTPFYPVADHLIAREHYTSIDDVDSVEDHVPAILTRWQGVTKVLTPLLLALLHKQNTYKPVVELLIEAGATLDQCKTYNLHGSKYATIGVRPYNCFTGDSFDVGVARRDQRKLYNQTQLAQLAQSLPIDGFRDPITIINAYLAHPFMWDAPQPIAGGTLPTTSSASSTASTASTAASPASK